MQVNDALLENFLPEVIVYVIAKVMPEISRFYGIIIRIFFESGRHQLPHIHAAYGEYIASYSIDPPALLAGTLPRKQQNLVIAWIELHQDELIENWNLASQGLSPRKIPGLR